MRFRSSLFLTMLPVLAASLLSTAPALAQAHAGHTATAGTALPTITVHKGPECGCCDKWIAMAKAEGFKVEVVVTDDLSDVKRKAGVPAAQEACHTATAGGYVFEGHVPLDLVRKVLETRPAIAGLLVAGMPPSSPGMEEVGQPHQPYEVLAMGLDGKLTTYARR
ncbi:MAG TPA: DUF411 domain-containing protein [Thermoleophilia bacterium]|nr:DUF411 domain-containing protein [Thermoleophilia bacterium]